jgi:hypothetical protein
VLYKAVAHEKIHLRGAFSFESVVDEEEAGVNATIAGRCVMGRWTAQSSPKVPS